MPTTITRRLLAASFIGFLSCVCASAQRFDDILGKWSMTSDTDEQPVKWSMRVSGTASKPVAMLSTEEGEQPARDVAYSKGTLTFKVTYEGQEYTIDLKYMDGKLDGSWNGNGNSGKTTGTKGS